MGKSKGGKPKDKEGEEEKGIRDGGARKREGDREARRRRDCRKPTQSVCQMLFQWLNHLSGDRYRD